MTKVTVDLPSLQAREDLWAEEVGEGTFKLKSVPFYSYGLNQNDLVLVEPDPSRELVVRKIIRSGGNCC